jgi:glycosyltransferase involved in cell wall biosynthesis
MVFLEGWMRSKPVIENAFCEPVASIIDHGENGYLCRTSEEIARRMLQLMADAKLARALGQAGRRKAEQYTWNAVAARVRDLYGKVTRK